MQVAAPGSGASLLRLLVAATDSLRDRRFCSRLPATPRACGSACKSAPREPILAVVPHWCFAYESARLGRQTPDPVLETERETRGLRRSQRVARFQVGRVKPTRHRCAHAPRRLA